MTIIIDFSASIPIQLHLAFNGNVTTVRSAEILIDYPIVLMLERYWSVCKKVEIKALGGPGWSSRTVTRNMCDINVNYFIHYILTGLYTGLSTKTRG